TGAVIPWPVNSGRPVSWRWARLLRRGAHAAPQPGRPAWLDDLPARAGGHGQLPDPGHVEGQESPHAAGSPAGGVRGAFSSESFLACLAQKLDGAIERKIILAGRAGNGRNAAP